MNAMGLPERIWAVMEIDGLELRVRPQRPAGGTKKWYEARWYTAAIHDSFSGRWVWADGEGDTQQEAIADLLENCGEDIEAYCKQREEDGYELPA